MSKVKTVFVHTTEFPTWLLLVLFVLAWVDMVDRHGWFGLALMAGSATAGWVLAAWHRNHDERASR